MASFTLIAANNMVNRFAGLLRAVMTAIAIANHLRMIKPGNLRPSTFAMTVSTIVRRKDMMHRLATTRNQRTTSMAAAAIFGRTFKAAINMADFALHKTVKAIQREARGIMIKFRSNQ